jgi:hypothetical protein
MKPSQLKSNVKPMVSNPMPWTHRQIHLTDTIQVKYWCGGSSIREWEIV